MYGQSTKALRSAFHPDADPESLQALREAFLASRRDYSTRTLAMCAEMAPDETRKAIGNGLRDVLRAAPDGEDALYIDPVFSTWVHFFNRAVSRRNEDEVRFHCARLDEVIGRVKQRLSGREPLYIAGTQIAVQQEDVDPYIMAATPPSYDFAGQKAGTPEQTGPGHPLALQQELLGIAMDNIGKAWPELRTQIEDVVQIVGYLPDASFRSCSAARYAGVIYLGNMDERLLDVEESIVHEAGHQVLYRVGELVELVKPGTSQKADFTLPWSGSRRDLFGFLHAFYIYTLLTKYFWHRAAVNERERRDCVRRAALIQIGNRRAIPMLLQASDLSAQGRQLVEVLAEDMTRLEAELEAALDEAPLRNG